MSHQSATTAAHPHLVKPNYQGIYDYKLTNGGINIYRHDRPVLEIPLHEFSDFMRWDFLKAIWMLTDPDEDFSYYCQCLSDFISQEEAIKQETI